MSLNALYLKKLHVTKSTAILMKKIVFIKKEVTLQAIPPKHKHNREKSRTLIFKFHLYLLCKKAFTVILGKE